MEPGCRPQWRPSGLISSAKLTDLMPYEDGMLKDGTTGVIELGIESQALPRVQSQSISAIPRWYHRSARRIHAGPPINLPSPSAYGSPATFIQRRPPLRTAPTPM